MNKEITTDMLLDMIKKIGWDVNGVGILRNIDAEATIMRQEKQITDLETKLAEKEREIKDLEKEVDDWCHKIMRQGTHHSLELSKALEKANQDKISFAVEQLEKVKEFADIDFRKNCYINAVELDKFIDNQIEELKKEMR